MRPTKILVSCHEHTIRLHKLAVNAYQNGAVITHIPLSNVYIIEHKQNKKCTTLGKTCLQLATCNILD